MQLSDDDIHAFMVAYEKSFERPIEFDAAREMGTRLMTVLLLTSRIPPPQREQPPAPQAS